MSASGSQIVQQFCIKGERASKCNSIALNRAVKKKKSQYTQIYFIYIHLKKDIFWGLERPDPRCFPETPPHCCLALGTLGGAQRGQARAEPSPALCWRVHCLCPGREGMGSVCSDAPRRSSWISLGSCPCTLRHRDSWGSQEGVGRGNCRQVPSQTLTYWGPVATGSLLFLTRF